MSVEPRIIPNWSALQGTILPGGYEIEQCLSASPSQALFKLRILGDRFTDAVLRVFAPGAVPSEQLETWHDSLALRHANLSTPLTAGLTAIDSAPIPYVASVRAEETLDSILAERALKMEEARDALPSVLAGLSYLHGAGWVHSVLAPQAVLAIGNAIQLSGDRLCRISAAPAGNGVENIARYLAPEAKGANTTPAADVYCLGATLFEVLSRQQFDEKARAQIATLPHPFADLVEACVRPDPAARPTLHQIGVLLRSPAPVRVEKVVTAPVSAEAKAEPKPVPASVPPVVPALPVNSATAETKPPGPVPQPLPIPSRPLHRSQPEPAQQEPLEAVWLGMPARRWLYLFAAVVALLAILWLFHPRAAHSVATPPANPAAKATWPPHVVGPAAVPSPPVPSAGHPSAGHNAISARSVATPVAKDAVWRVVVYTFYRQADAEKRLKAIKAQHPGFEPNIFMPKGNGSPYLIALGGRMTKEEAERLRNKAKASGLPRDAFIQNYTR